MPTNEVVDAGYAVYKASNAKTKTQRDAEVATYLGQKVVGLAV
jgi:hypothetical protein